jgi:hypothetical protein
MNRKQMVVVIVVVLLIVVALAASIRTFLATPPTSESTYTAPVSAVRASLGETATTKTISLRLNSVTDVSNPATRNTWVKFDLESVGYNLSLTPSPGERYLVANLTVTNVQPKAVHFSYMDFALLTPNNNAFYANAAVCSASCSHALENRTLSAGFTSNLYVLFSVPEGANVKEVVYTTSAPPIVLSTA